MRNAALKLTFIILTFNVTFINKSHGEKKMHFLKPDPSPK